MSKYKPYVMLALSAMLIADAGLHMFLGERSLVVLYLAVAVVFMELAKLVRRTSK